MADSIVDGRTSLTTNDSGGLDNLAGSASGSTDTTTFIEGSGSQSIKISMAVAGLLWDNGTAIDLSGNVFYFWVNCTTAGLLATKAAGGLRVRFCGATVTDFFEVYVEGGDTYSGGFKMIVVDIDEAKTISDNTGGTPPATSAIRYAGVVGDISANVGGNVDNFYVDAWWRLPANTPGIRVEGLESGTTDWTWQDILDAADIGDTTKAWGTIERLKNGTISINTPVRFGVDDTDDHGFDDEGETIGWEDALVPDAFYGIDIIGNSGGTTNFDLGVKTGSGDDATGALGGAIITGGPRWFLTVNDADVDSANFYGVTLEGAGTILADDPATAMISCTFIDCLSALVSNIGDFLRCKIISAATADGVAFVTTDDLTDIAFSDFTFSDGHAVELTTPIVASQTSKGNLFTSYLGTPGSNPTPSSGSTDAAIYNNAAGAVTVAVGDSGDTPSVRNGASATTVVTNAKTVTITVLDDAGADLASARVQVEADAGDAADLPHDETVTITRSGSVATVVHTAHGIPDGEKVVIRNAAQKEYNIVAVTTLIDDNSYSYTVSGTPDTPATIAEGKAAITATGVILEGLTDGSGVLTRTDFPFGTDQPLTGIVRKSTAAPFFKTQSFSGTLTTNGYTNTVQMVLDE